MSFTIYETVGSRLVMAGRENSLLPFDVLGILSLILPYKKPTIPTTGKKIYGPYKVTWWNYRCMRGKSENFYLYNMLRENEILLQYFQLMVLLQILEATKFIFYMYKLNITFGIILDLWVVLFIWIFNYVNYSVVNLKSTFGNTNESKPQNFWIIELSWSSVLTARMFVRRIDID